MSTGRAIARSLLHRDPNATRTGTVLALVAALALWYVGGLAGATAGLVLVVVQMFVPAFVVFALGQVALAAVLPDGAALATVAIAEAPLVALVLRDALDAVRPGRAAVVTAACLSVGVGLAVLLLGVADALWVVAVAVAAVFALAGYGLHRYTVVRFDVSYDEY